MIEIVTDPHHLAPQCLHDSYHAYMSQITIRADEELIERVRSMAGAGGWSMNEFVVLVLDAATNPQLAGSPVQQLRERLVTAGLAPPLQPRSGPRPDAAKVRGARTRAGKATLLSDIVADAR